MYQTIIKQITELGKANGYEMTQSVVVPPVLIFKKEGVQINVYYTTLSVVTILNHPTKGKTQLTRRSVSISLLEEIFKAPRVHTGKGYYRKPVLPSPPPLPLSSVTLFQPIAFFRCVSCWKVFKTPTDKIKRVTVDGKIQKMCVGCIAKHSKKSFREKLLDLILKIKSIQKT